MIGLVLAAGAGRRLGAHTVDLPKALLPVRGATSILEITLTNLAAAGVSDVAVVTGFAEHRIAAAVPGLEERCGVQLELVHNDRALEWNNAYSLWCARRHLVEGVLLCNGDTVHPASVEQSLLAAPPNLVTLAVDSLKALGEEQMKVRLDADGRVLRIHKQLPVESVHGEYIGLTRISPDAAAHLADALEATWRRDPGLYYEDAFQELVDRGVPVDTVDVGAVDWVEVDDEADLAAARNIACRY